MTQYKTQCPRCHTIYPMPNDKLNQPKARANCGKCHHTFFLNSNLIKPTDERFAPKPVDTTVDVNAVASNIGQTTPTPNNKPKDISSATRFTQQDHTNSTSTTTHQHIQHDNTLTPNKDVPAPDFEGLDTFMQSDVATPAVDTPKDIKPKNSQAESLIDDLLTENKKTNDTNDIFGSEFANIPIESASAPLDQKELQKRVEKRLATQSPSAEKLSKQRGFFGQLMWFIGCIGLLILMAGQYIIFNTDKIAKHPSHSGLLYTLCGHISCDLPKADPNAFRNTYELKPDNQGGTNLIGTLNNDSGEDQLYPNLKISIYDHNGQLLGDFVATPKDYLTVAQRLLSTNQGKRYMFTLPNISPQQIKQVKIEPFY